MAVYGAMMLCSMTVGTLLGSHVWTAVCYGTLVAIYVAIDRK